MFTPAIAAAVLVVLAGVLAIFAARAGADFLPSLNVRHPALATLTPTRNAPPPRVSRRVILVIIDGLRLKDSFGTPYLTSLRRAGIDAAARSHFPTISRANYVSIVTGVPPAASGVRSNDYNWPVPLDNLMARAKDAGLDSAYVADYTPSFGFLFPDDVTDLYYTPWPGGFERAAKAIVERDYPLVVLLPGKVDAMGHRYGADSPEYQNAISFVDRQLASALASVDLSRDTIIICADHGHTDSGGHGGIENEVMRVPLIMAGAGIREGAAIGPANLIDIAPTVAALLGISAPGHGLGRPLTSALALDPTTRASIDRAGSLRAARNIALLSDLERAEASALDASRTRRVGFVVLLCAIGIALIFVGRRIGALHIDWRVLAIAVPAFPVAYYALLDTFGQHFSLSAIPDRSDAMDLVFAFGLVSTGIHILASRVALRGRVVLRDRLAAANALTLCGMFVSILPGGLMWAVLSERSSVSLPSPSMVLLIPATYIAVACYALASAVTLTLEILIFFARAVDPRMRLRRLERAAARERRRLDDTSDATLDK